MTSEELKQRREALGLTQAELASAIGKSRKTLNSYENGSQIPDSTQKLLNIYFDGKEMRNELLLLKAKDEAEGRISYTELDEKSNIPKEAEAMWVNHSSFMMVPLVHHRAQAGFLSGWGDVEYLEELPKVPFEVDREYKGRYVCFEVSGDSMLNENNIDSLFERDILLCREVQRIHWKSRLHIHNWKYFVVVHRDRGILVKQITHHDTETGRLVLHSLNEYYEDQEVYMDDLIAIFNVVDIKRSARR